MEWHPFHVSGYQDARLQLGTEWVPIYYRDSSNSNRNNKFRNLVSRISNLTIFPEM